MSPITRKGLLNLENIRKVLDKERSIEEYKALRKQLTEDEPVLDSNLQHWIKQEVNQLSGRFPTMCRASLDWVGHLLERYLVRGFYVCREANAELLAAWFNKNCENPPDREKIGDSNVDKRD
jgi:hypothetical protein